MSKENKNGRRMGEREGRKVKEVNLLPGRTK